MHAFGPIGILYGPLILSFLLVMLNIYGEEFHDSLSHGFRDEEIDDKGPGNSQPPDGDSGENIAATQDS